MIVRCILNDISTLQNEMLVKRLKRYINLDCPDYDLVIGSEYYVQAIESRDSGWWYYIHTVEVNDYPYPYPCEFFEVINSALEIGWTLKMGSVEDRLTIKRISFAEWAADDFFYEKLIDDDPDCKQLYLKQLKKQY